VTDVIDVQPTAGELVAVGAPAPAMMVPRSLGGLPYLGDYLRLAEAISRTELVPQALRGRPDAVVAVMMAGYELGIAPMQALQSINLIQGTPSLSAELMRALILQSGHQIIVEATNEAATVQYRRRDWPVEKWSTITYTIDDARTAGLVEWYEKWESTQSGKRFKKTWNPHSEDPKPDWVDTPAAERKKGENYYSRPRAMLTARATSEAARNAFADVLAGLSYTPDEILEFAPVSSGLSRPEEPSAPSQERPPAPESEPGAEEAMQSLADIIKSIEDDTEREALKRYLHATFGPSGQMTLTQIEAATPIASGWPATDPMATTATTEAPRQGEPF
jgi:hypothetical protein